MGISSSADCLTKCTELSVKLLSFTASATHTHKNISLKSHVNQRDDIFITGVHVIFFQALHSPLFQLKMLWDYNSMCQKHISHSIVSDMSEVQMLAHSFKQRVPFISLGFCSAAQLYFVAQQSHFLNIYSNEAADWWTGLRTLQINVDVFVTHPQQYYSQENQQSEMNATQIQTWPLNLFYNSLHAVNKGHSLNPHRNITAQVQGI